MGIETIAAIGLGLSAVGTASSVMGQMQQAQGQKASANYQSQVAAGNAAIATQNAQFSSASGNEQAAIQQQKTRAQVGAIEAGQASSGVDINSPTSTAVRTSQTELGALDAQTIRSTAARTAFGYETQSTNFENQASAYTAQGENAQTAGDIGAAGSLLSGLGNASSNYASILNKAGGVGDGSVGSQFGALYDNAIGAGG